MLMERNAEVTRGWPNEGALDRNELIATGQSLSNGDWVVPGSAGIVIAGATAANNGCAGLVIQGNADSGSAAYAGKAVVLWGNFIARIKNYTAGSYSAGTPLMIVSGKVAPQTSTNPIVGYVLDVVAAVSTVTAGNLNAPNDAYIVAKFN